MKIEEAIADIMNLALRNLLSEKAQDNLNEILKKANGSLSEKAREEAIEEVDKTYPLKSVQKLPGTLIYVGYDLAPINTNEEIVGEVGEIQQETYNKPFNQNQNSGENNRGRSENRNPNFRGNGSQNQNPGNRSRERYGNWNSSSRGNNSRDRNPSNGRGSRNSSGSRTQGNPGMGAIRNNQPIKNLQAKKEAKKKMVSNFMDLIDSVFDEIQNSPGNRSRDPSRESHGSRSNSANRGNWSGSAEVNSPHPMKAFIDQASEEEILNNQHYCYMCGSSTHLAKQCRVYTALTQIGRAHV